MKWMLTLATGLLAAGSMEAHHSVNATFEAGTQFSLTGEFVDLQWGNPHVSMHVKAKDAKGILQTWLVEGGPPFWYQHLGLNKASFAKHVKQQVTVLVSPAKDGSIYAYLLKITFADGETLDLTPAADAAKAK